MKHGIFTVALFAFFTVTSRSYSAMPITLYQEALQAVQNKIKQNQQSAANALTTSMIKSMLGRYYQVGDNWDVISWQFHHSLTPLKRGESSQSKFELGEAGLFHYQVKEVKTGVTPKILVRVDQQESTSIPKPDPRVNYLSLGFSDQYSQTEKTYYMQDSKQGVQVFADGLRTRVSSLELFPLDVPDVATAEKKQISTPFLIPAKLREISKKAGIDLPSLDPDLGHGSFFEQDDFFGRPMQIYWVNGDPWPKYIRTQYGISILIHKGSV